MTQDEAIAKIHSVLPHLRHAIKSAKSEAGAEAQIGILATKPSGSGRIVAQFRADEFIDDLCVALGFSTENTPDEENEARVERIIQAVGRGGGRFVSTPLDGSPRTDNPMVPPTSTGEKR